jgi:hypothetical protein
LYEINMWTWSTNTLPEIIWISFSIATCLLVLTAMWHIWTLLRFIYMRHVVS